VAWSVVVATALFYLFPSRLLQVSQMFLFWETLCAVTIVWEVLCSCLSLLPYISQTSPFLPLSPIFWLLADFQLTALYGGKIRCYLFQRHLISWSSLVSFLFPCPSGWQSCLLPLDPSSTCWTLIPCFLKLQRIHTKLHSCSF
jgi:hypothetical protein